MKKILKLFSANSQTPVFAESAHMLKQLLSREEASDEELKTVIADLFAALPGTDRKEVEEAMNLLADVFFLVDESRSTTVMMICGNLMEKGYYSARVSEQMIEKVLFLTDSAYPFYEAFRSEMEKNATIDVAEEESDESELIELLKESLWDSLSDSIISWNALEDQYIPAVSVFSIDTSARETARKIEHISELAPCNQGCFWLDKLFNVLFEEPVLIIEPETRLGFIGKISGVEDNFQLHALVMHSFPQKEGSEPRISIAQADVFKGNGPQTLSGSITGTWNMYNWSALESNLLLPDLATDSSHHWIWHEGIPADIAKWNEFRVILLGKPSYSRGIRLQRTFGQLKAGIQIEKQLTPDEVTRWLSDIVTTRNKL